MRTTWGSFAAGILDRVLHQRTDLDHYSRGCSDLLNVGVLRQGQLMLDPGSVRLPMDLTGVGAIWYLTRTPGETYLLAFKNLSLDVWDMRDFSAEATGIVTPWASGILSSLKVLPLNDVLIVTHRTTEPQKVSYNGPGDWTVAGLTYTTIDTDAGDGGGTKYAAPMRRYANPEITLRPNAEGSAGQTRTLTASSDFFVAGHVGVHLEIKNRWVVVTEILSATQARVTQLETFKDTKATTDWSEEAYSALRGWPQTSAFFQGRLHLLGGDGDGANGVNASRATDIWDFTVRETNGTTTNDGAVATELVGDSFQWIEDAVPAGQALLVGTRSGVWVIQSGTKTSSGYGPQNIQRDPISRRGMQPDTRMLGLGGSVLMITSGGTSVLETTAEPGQDGVKERILAVHAESLFGAGVVSLRLQDADRLRRVWAVLADGTAIVVSFDQANAILGPSRVELGGASGLMDVLFWPDGLTEDRGVYLLSDKALEIGGVPALDDATVLTAESPTTSWTASSRPGETLVAVADNTRLWEVVLDGSGNFTLPKAASTVAVGYEREWLVETLPAEQLGQGRDTRLGQKSLQEAWLVLDSGSLRGTVTCNGGLPETLEDGPGPLLVESRPESGSAFLLRCKWAGTRPLNRAVVAALSLVWQPTENPDK